MKVLFIIPTPGYGIIDDNNRVMKRRAGLFPPLGAAFLASVLDREGHSCRVIDLQITQYTSQQLADEIKSFQPGAVCISILTALAPEAFKAAAIAKSQSDVPVICGGQHAGLFAEYILESNNNIDYIVFGEGEYKLRNLVDAIEKDKPTKDVKGVYYRENGKALYTGDAPAIMNLDELPIPSRKYFDMKKYIPVANQYKRLPMTNMITSRGCTYRMCKYCSESGKLHSNYRRNSVKRAIEEVKYLVDEYKMREIYFWDDEFVMGNKWVDDFCSELKKEKFDLTWSCYAKVNYVNKDILKTMAGAGCWNIFYGLESGSQELLNNLKKGQSIQQIRDAVKWTQDAGIEAKGSFMLGLPGENPELAKKTIDFSINLDLDYAMFAITTPFPGTQLYEDFVKDGGLEETKNIEYNKYTCFYPVYLPKGYQDRQQLIDLHKLAYRKFYLRFGYLKRKFKSINSTEDIVRYLKGMHFLLKMKLLNSPGL